MVHPLLGLLPLIAKNTSILNALAAAETYGYHRCYRRVLEYARMTKLPTAQREVLRQGIKQSLRFPASAYHTLTSSEVYNVVQVYARHVVEAAELDKRVPPFFVPVAKFFLKKTTVGKWFEFIEKNLSKVK